MSHKVSKLTLLFWFVVIFAFSAKTYSSAQDLTKNWEPNNRPQVRTMLNSCATLLAPSSQVHAAKDPSDGAGVLLTRSHDIAEIESAIDKLIELYGKEELEGGQLYVTGVDMQDEKKLKRAYEEMLEKKGFSINKNSELNNFARGTLNRLSQKDVWVRVLSLPKEDLELVSSSFFSRAWDRVKYWFPSLKRDMEIPFKKEVKNNLKTDLSIEAPTSGWFFFSMDPISATLTTISHTTYVTLLSVYSKAFVNWILRPVRPEGKELQNERVLKFLSGVSGYLKQSTASATFIANYQIFANGNFLKIIDYYDTYGFAATAAAFPQELQAVLSEQSVTLVLQVFFYNLIIQNGIGRWMNSVDGLERSQSARAIAPFIRAPFLIADAIILAVAAGAGIDFFAGIIPGADQTLSLGPLTFNFGHGLLLGLTAISSPIFFKPEILNPTLDYYDRYKKRRAQKRAEKKARKKVSKP